MSAIAVLAAFSAVAFLILATIWGARFYRMRRGVRMLRDVARHREAAPEVEGRAEGAYHGMAAQADRILDENGP